MVWSSGGSGRVGYDGRVVSEIHVCTDHRGFMCVFRGSGVPHGVLAAQVRRPSPHARCRSSNTSVAAKSHGCCFWLKPLSSSATRFLERHPLSMCNPGARRREEGEEREPGELRHKRKCGCQNPWNPMNQVLEIVLGSNLSVPQPRTFSSGIRCPRATNPVGSCKATCNTRRGKENEG